jgi:hypothetical protein
MKYILVTELLIHTLLTLTDTTGYGVQYLQAILSNFTSILRFGLSHSVVGNVMNVVMDTYRFWVYRILISDPQAR